MAEQTSSASEAAFLEWLLKNGVQGVDKLQFITVPEMGRGVATKSDLTLAPNTPLVQVPKSLWITFADSIAHPDLAKILADRSISETLKGSSADCILALRLLLEKHSATPSKWRPWLDLLPEKLNCTTFWSNEDLAQIEGCNLFDKTKTHKNQIEQEYFALFPKLFKKFPNLFHKRKHSREEYFWALGIVWTRSVEINTGKGLERVIVPLLDMFNHSFDSKLQYGSSGKDVAIVSLPASEKESVVITAGSQVFVNYGPLANATLMHLKGFAVSPNPYDHVELLMAMDPRSESYNDKVRMLKQAGIDQPNGPYFLKAADLVEKFPSKILGALRIQRISGGEDFGRARFAWDDNEIISMENEVNVLRSLQEGFQSMIERIKFGYEDDLKEFIGLSALAPEALPAPNKRYALYLRLADRKILFKALTYIGEKQNAIVYYLQDKINRGETTPLVPDQ